MAYITGSFTSGSASEMFPNFGGETGTGSTGQSAYGKLLSLLKKFVCGEASEPTAGANTGNGVVMHLEPTQDVTTRSWTLTFSSATAFSITASGETTVNGTLTGSAPNRTVAISAERFTLSVYEGSTPFTSGDSFTFTTTASGMNAGETWDVLADTAKGTAPANYYSDLWKKTLSGTTSNRGTITSVRYYGQSQINDSYYITFPTTSTFQVRRTSAPGTVIGSGTCGVPLEIPGVMDITVTLGSTVYTVTTYTGSTPSGGNYFTLSPNTSAPGANSNLTRVVVLRNRGFDGSYNIYHTICQRSGNNNARWFLEGYCHSGYDPEVVMLSQQNISPVWRIKHKNPLNSEQVLYYIVADAVCAKVLTLPHADDPQGAYFGMYIPHSSPSEDRFPVCVGGCVAYDNTSVDLTSTVDTNKSAPFFFSPAKMSYIWPPGGASGSPWIEMVGNGDAPSNTALSGFYSYPWNNSYTAAAQIHSGVYGELGTKKLVTTSRIVISKNDVFGVAGEYHGVFYINPDASVTNTVTRGDTVTGAGNTHLVWKCSNSPSQSHAAFLLG